VRRVGSTFGWPDENGGAPDRSPDAWMNVASGRIDLRMAE
jgi:hypothetical protein